MLGRHGDAGGVVDLASAAAGHPVAELQHVGPARGGLGFGVGGVVEVLLVADGLEPVGQEGARRLVAHGVLGAVAQVVDLAPELVQAAHGARRQRGT